MTRSARTAALALPFLFCLLPPSAFSQQQDETFEESVDVRVVNIEVYVTDNEGKRVTGLTRDDFEVYEDGKKMEVTHFYASEGKKTGAALAEPEVERLQLAVYFDLQALPSQRRQQLMRVIEDFLVARARPGEQALIASFIGADTLQVRPVPMERPALASVLQKIVEIRKPNLTGSPDARAIAGAGGGAGGGAGIAGASAGSGGGGGGRLGAAMAELEAAESAWNRETDALMVRAMTQVDLEALVAFLEGIGSLPGRKAVLYVAGGATFSPGQTAFSAMWMKYGGMVDELKLRPLFARLEKVVNSDRILFYSLGAIAGNGAEFGRSYDGRPEDALAWIDEELDSYYSLGYTPAARRKPGKRYDVEVRVKRPGLNVHHVEEYHDRTPRERAHNRTMAALLFGDGMAVNPLGARLEVGRAEAVGKDQATVPIKVTFPLSEIALLPRNGAHEGRLSLFVAARDDEGMISEVTELLMPIRLKAPALPGQRASYTTRMALRPRPHTIALGIRDELGNTVSTVTAPYVPEAAVAAAERR